jgi:DNA processing protein
MTISTLNILILLSTKGIGRKSVTKIINCAVQDPDGNSDLLEIIKIAKRSHGRIKLPTLDDIETARATVEKGLELADALQIKSVNFQDSDYPSKLRQIEDPPLVLFSRGNSALFESTSVAVIGTREPSDYGYQSGFKIAASLAKSNMTIVSGLALGCDSAAHEGCLSENGKTIAVLAHGLDTIYPAKNKKLAERILENNGSLVSEYLPGTPSRNNYFVERDRIQSGLSHAVIVIETDIEGGTMHTVKFCQEQNRILSCLEHPEKYQDLKTTKGNQKLISEGALALKDATDLEKLKDMIVTAENKSNEQLPTNEQMSLIDE